MSTNLLYHAFDIRGYQYVNTRYQVGAVHFTIQQEKEELCCPVCKSRRVIRRGIVHRMFRSVSIGRKLIYIRLAVQRVLCKACGKLR